MPDDPRGVLTRPAPPPDLAVRYGEHPDQVIDVRLPRAGAEPRPLVIFIHGGFWRAEWDRSHAGPLAADLAARGWPVATVEFRRTGQDGGGWPGTFDDVAAAVGAARGLGRDAGAQSAGALPAGVDPVAFQRPILAGHSAGGQLALWYAATHGHEGSLRGVLALAPVADLAAAYRLDLDGGAVAALLGGGPERWPDRYAAADPVVLGPPPAPVAVLHGTADSPVPVALSRAYAAAAGDRVRLVELPGVDHFGLIDPESAAWPAVLDALSGLSS
jgi:acetyl esterase/lipase